MRFGMVFPRMVLRQWVRGRRLTQIVWRRYHEENFAQVSGALVFTTLLGLVPLVTVMLSLLSALPFFPTLLAQLEVNFVNNLLPLRTGETISNYILNFTRQARQLTPVGLLMLATTAFLLLHTIERTFNHLWQVTTPRPLLQRLQAYLVAMTLGPLVLGVLATLIPYVVSTSLGVFSGASWLHTLVLKLTATMMLAGFLAFLYATVPNAVVCPRAALWGGSFAALAFMLLQKGFEVYLAASGFYRTLYGSFAIFPIFLLWVYLSWSIVLIGGLLAAAFRDRRRH